MNGKVVNNHVRAALVAVLMMLLYRLPLMAADGTWTGADDSIWTNGANWSVATYPSGAEQATFSGSGGGHTTVDLGGLSGIKTIVFDTAGVVPYVLGTGGAAGQTLILENSALAQLTSTAGAGQRIDASVQLGRDRSFSTYTLQNDNESQLLAVVSDIAGALSGGTAGTKTLKVQGVGNVTLDGSLSDGGASSVKLVSYVEGVLTLGGANTFSGDVELYSGTLKLTHPAALNDSGRLLLRSPEPSGAFVEIAHDGVGETPFRAAIGIGNTATLVSGTDAGGVGVNHTLSELGMSEVTLNFTRSAAVMSGSPSITAQAVILNGNGSYTSIVNPTSADLILGDVWIPSGSYRKTLVLDGTSSGNRVEGVISNGINRLSLVKANSSTWTLVGENVYTGETSVTGGTLALAGVDGAIKDSLGVSLEGGALLLDNTGAANADRLADNMPISLSGGTLIFSHAAGAADYSETAGELTVSVGAGSVDTAQAAPGQSSTLTFASLVCEGGAVDFAGEGLGVDARNRVFFSTPPTLTGGIIGSWATVNGTNLATYGANGIMAYNNYADITAKGPSTVPDDETACARINSEGTSGGIGLAGSATNRINLIMQNTVYPATVSMAGKTLLTSGFLVNPGMASLTLGDAANDGVLAPLAEGGALNLNNQASESLIVNPAVRDNAVASSVIKNGPGNVIIRGTTDYTGPTVINDGALTYDGQGTPQTLIGVISGAGALVKSGTNVLHLMAANTYTGPTVINGGTLQANVSQTFGDTAQGDVTVADGATLDIGCAPDVGGTGSQDSLNFGSQLFTVSGAGVDGKGVIVNRSTVRQLNAFGQIALVGDATFGGTGDWRVRNNAPVLTLNGHTLTKAGTNVIELYSADVFPGDGHIVATDGFMRLLYNTDLHGSETNTLTVHNGVTLELYRLSPASAPLWTLDCKDNAIIRVGNESTVADNEWAGPVLLEGQLNLTAGGGYHQTFSGEISGLGSILKYASHTVSLTGTNNTYSGGTTVSNGVLVACSAGSLPGYDAPGNVTVLGGGRLDVRVGDGTLGWTAAQIDALHDTATFTDNTAILGIDTTPADLVYADAITRALALTKCGSGSLTLAGANSFSGLLTVEGGTLALSGSNALPGGITVSDGMIDLPGDLDQSAAVCNVTGSSGRNAVMRMTSGSSVSGTGNFRVGTDNNTHGAFYLEGGIFDRPTSTSDGAGLAFGYNAGGYGYLKISGGSLTSPRLQLGPSSGTTVGYGIVRMTGGTLNTRHSVHIGRYSNGVGVFTLDGGVYAHTNNTLTYIQMGYSGGHGELNITGGKLESTGQLIELRRNSGSSTNSINLCSGYLAVDYLKNTSPGVAWLNFCGGTLKAGAINSTAFVPTTLTGVYAYGPVGNFAGGANIDTAGRNVTVATPVQAPPGNGVMAVTLSGGGSGYIGEPYVSIRGGGGQGATAVADMTDDGSGNGTYRVASVTVTCPGFGYTDTPTVTFLRGGSGVIEPTLSGVTLAPNASGGLTKIGAGTLTLGAANTYTGTTTVTEGTLKLGNAAALASGSMVALNGGTLDLNGYTVTNAVSGAGTVANGALEAVLSPAGSDVVGTATVMLSGATLSGTYLADVTGTGESDYAVIEGDLDLSNLILQLVDPGQLDRHHSYTLLSSTGTLTGTLTVSNAPDSRWHVAYLANDTVKLLFVDGTLLKLR